MSRVTKAQLEGVEADRDNLRDELAQTRDLLAQAYASVDAKQRLLDDAYAQQDRDSQEIYDLTVKIQQTQDDALRAIDGLAEQANETINDLDDKVAFLTQTLVSILTYRGSQVNTVRGLAVSALNDFVDPETLNAIA